MKFLRNRFIQGISIWLVITGLTCINASIGNLAKYFPNTNVNNLLAEETNKDFEDSSPENDTMDGDSGFLNEFDWHISSLPQLSESTNIAKDKLHSIIQLNFGNVHLDRFSPPPEA